MNTEHYECVKSIIESDRIGSCRMARIYRGLAVENVSRKDALASVLYDDMEFILDILGDVDRVYAKSVDFYNTIVIMKHENKSLSHISVNLYDEHVLETFRLEVAGTKGLIEYDSDKESTILYHRKQNTSLKELEFNDVDKRNRKDVQDVILKIFEAVDLKEVLL